MTRRTLLCCFAAWSAAAGSSAADGEGTAGGILVRLPFGARSLALGGMHGTLRDAPAAMTANPAALAAAGEAAVEGGFHQSAGDTRYGGLAGAYAPRPWLAAGVSYSQLTAGELEAWDVVGSRVTAALQEDRAIGAGAAAAWGPAAFGVGLRHYASTVAGIAAGSALLADAGARVRIELTPPPGWDPDLSREDNPNGIDLSLAATGLGGRADYGGAADPGPAVFRFGAALQSALGKAGSLVLASLDTPRETARLQAGLGWELRFPFDEVTVSGRAGGRFRKGSGTFAAGLGAEFRGIALDYAFVSADSPFAATHHLTAGFHLAAFQRAVRRRDDHFEPSPDGGASPSPTPAATSPGSPRTPPPPADSVPSAPEPPPAPDASDPASGPAAPGTATDAATEAAPVSPPAPDSGPPPP